MDEKSVEPGSLMIGEGVTISGSFTVPARVVINGTVEGEISAKEMLIGATGRVVGKVSAEVVEIYGEVNDALTASKALVLRASGRASGSIQYAELEIEKGAQLRGTLTVIDSAPPPAMRAPAPAPAAVAPRAAPHTNGAAGPARTSAHPPGPKN